MMLDERRGERPRCVSAARIEPASFDAVRQPLPGSRRLCSDLARGTDENQRPRPVREVQAEPLRNHPTHRDPEHMCGRDAEGVHQVCEIARKARQ